MIREGVRVPSEVFLAVRVFDIQPYDIIRDVGLVELLIYIFDILI